MKYIRRSTSLDLDFQHYLGMEGLFGHFFGFHFTPSEKRKVNYIWKKLLLQHYTKHGKKIN